jgi:MORN repeat
MLQSRACTVEAMPQDDQILERRRICGYAIIKPGEMVDGLRCGRGVMQFGNKERYTGQWSDGKKHGEGAYRYANGEFYKGNWLCVVTVGLMMPKKAMVNTTFEMVHIMWVNSEEI